MVTGKDFYARRGTDSLCHNCIAYMPIGIVEVCFIGSSLEYSRGATSLAGDYALSGLFCPYVMYILHKIFYQAL